MNGTRPGNVFCLMGDGERILVNERLSLSDEATIVLVQGWDREL